MLTVYTRPGCLFCQQVEDLLAEAGLPYKAIVVTDVAEQTRLISESDARSFPLVYSEEIYIGGFTHILYLHSQGRLNELAVDAELAEPAAQAVGDDVVPSSDPTRTARDELAAYAAWGEYLKNRKR